MNQLTAALIVVIGILGGFYVGAKYGQGHPTAAASSNAAAAGGGAGAGAFARGAGGAGGGTGVFGGGGAGGAAANATVGTITAVNGDTITVQNPRTNATVQVNTTSARITKTVDGSPADLTQNQAVTIIGQTGSDGVVTATTIAVGTTGFGGRGGAGAGAPSPSPSAGA